MNALNDGLRDATRARPGAAVPWLVADVGGTNARFGWVRSAGAAVEQVRTLPTADHVGPAEAAQVYLDGLRSTLGDAFEPPRQAALAVATAVQGDEVSFTNSAWRFSCAAVQRTLGLESLRVLNDFEALALSLPHLGSAQLRAHGALPMAQGTLAVIGPGTGLGVAAVVQTPAGWVAMPGEGGHATLAATDDEESAILQRVRREFSHVSAERLLSGIGLPVLHRAACAEQGAAPDTLATEQIVERGLAGDPDCARTLDLFCALLGSFAGSVALTFGARGGVYIGGGIVPRLGDRFFASRFREKFEAKGRFRDYLAPIPTAVITDTLAALTGAAAALQPPQP